MLGEHELILAKELIIASDFVFLGKMMVKVKVWVYFFCVTTSILGIVIPIICHKYVVSPYYTCTKLGFNISFLLEINLEKITGDENVPVYFLCTNSFLTHFRPIFKK